MQLPASPFPCPSHRARRVDNMPKQIYNLATAKKFWKAAFSRPQGKAYVLPFLNLSIYQVQKRTLWGSRNIKSSYKIWIWRSLWNFVCELGCSIFSAALIADLPVMFISSCSTFQNFNSILCILSSSSFFHTSCSNNLPKSSLSLL